MIMWNINSKGEKEFCGGKKDWKTAASIADNCKLFKYDTEEELVADEGISCYNCRYRRWTAESFICVKNSNDYKIKYIENEEVKKINKI